MTPEQALYNLWKWLDNDTRTKYATECYEDYMEMYAHVMTVLLSGLEGNDV